MLPYTSTFDLPINPPLQIVTRSASMTGRTSRPTIISPRTVVVRSTSTPGITSSTSLFARLNEFLDQTDSDDAERSDVVVRVIETSPKTDSIIGKFINWIGFEYTENSGRIKAFDCTRGINPGFAQGGELPPLPLGNHPLLCSRGKPRGINFNPAFRLLGFRTTETEPEVETKWDFEILSRAIDFFKPNFKEKAQRAADIAYDDIDEFYNKSPEIIAKWIEFNIVRKLKSEQDKMAYSLALQVLLLSNERFRLDDREKIKESYNAVILQLERIDSSDEAIDYCSIENITERIFAGYYDKSLQANLPDFSRLRDDNPFGYDLYDENTNMGITLLEIAYANDHLNLAFAIKSRLELIMAEDKSILQKDIGLFSQAFKEKQSIYESEDIENTRSKLLDFLNYELGPRMEAIKLFLTDGVIPNPEFIEQIINRRMLDALMPYLSWQTTHGVLKHRSINLESFRSLIPIINRKTGEAGIDELREYLDFLGADLCDRNILQPNTIKSAIRNGAIRELIPTLIWQIENLELQEQIIDKTPFQGLAIFIRILQSAWDEELYNPEVINKKVVIKIAGLFNETEIKEWEDLAEIVRTKIPKEDLDVLEKYIEKILS